MSNEVKVPRSALTLSPQENSRFELIEGDEKDKRTKFRMIANSGGVIEKHSHWGNFAIDLSGLKIGRQRKPALRDHDPQRIVGHTHSIQVTEEGLVAEGTFSDTPDGNEVMSMLADGFPWQASVYVPPKAIERLEEGETAEVNGFTISGPGHVFRESSLREVTWTAMGADENTHGAALSEVTINAVFNTAQSEEVFMDQPDPEVVEEIASVSDQAETLDDATLSNSVKSSVVAERFRISSFLEASVPSQFELVKELIDSDMSIEEGLKSIATNFKESMAQRLEHKLSSTPEPVGPIEEQTLSPREKFEADQELNAEFGSFDIFEAYTNAVERGNVPGRTK